MRCSPMTAPSSSRTLWVTRRAIQFTTSSFRCTPLRSEIELEDRLRHARGQRPEQAGGGLLREVEPVAGHVGIRLVEQLEVETIAVAHVVGEIIGGAGGMDEHYADIKIAGATAGDFKAATIPVSAVYSLYSPTELQGGGYTFGEIIGGLDEVAARYEAARCYSCGNCFECDGCYGSCPEQAIEKLGPGLGYLVDAERCTGCGACHDQCPCHAILLRQPEVSL